MGETFSVWCKSLQIEPGHGEETALNGELVQVIALVSYGNWYLTYGHDRPVPDLLNTNSTFQYVSSVYFAHYKDKHQTQGETVAADLTEWFRLLRSIGVSRLWNIAFAWNDSERPEYQQAGFAGAVPRAIQADLPAGYEPWYPQWRTEGSDTRPWVVEYRGLTFPHSHALPLIDLKDLKIRLQSAIQQAISFARKSHSPLQDGSEWLEGALQLLDASIPLPPFHRDMLPEEGYSLLARQLLATATQAYVFGGMGSWNDIGFEGSLQREYEKVSADLYEVIKVTTIMVPNSFLT